MTTISDINKNNSILPHIKLGWDIRDSCWYPAIALEQSIDFIQDAIASKAYGKLVSALQDSSGNTITPKINKSSLQRHSKQHIEVGVF
jgi:hypothetical protein